MRPCSGGMKKHLQDLVDYFSQDYRVVLMAPQGTEPLLRLNKNGVDYFELPPAPDLMPGRDLITVKMILSLIRRIKPDILHVHGYRAGLWGVPAGRISGAPVVCTVHGYPAVTDSFSLSRFMFSAAWRMHHNWPARYITVSGALAAFLEEQGKVAPERITVIHNGIDAGLFETEIEDKSGSRQKNCLDFLVKNGSLLVGAAARLAPQKGLEVFIKAAALLAGNLQNINFVIIGEGPLRGKLEKLVDSLGLKGRVFFTGYIEDLPAAISRLDLFVLPSSKEGLSITLLEALAASRPVVASNTGGVPEIIIDGETGCLVPPEDAPALARAIYKMIISPQDGARMAGAGRLRVKMLFSREEMLQKTARVYQEIMP